MSDFNARIKPLSIEEAILVGEKHGIDKNIAKLNVFRVLLRHPVLAKALNTPLMMLLFEGNQLSHRLRELIIMRLGWCTHSDYEWTQHWRIALLFGCSEEDLSAVKDWSNSQVLSNLDKIVLQAVDDTLEHGCILSKTWEGLNAQGLNDQQKLEVIACIGNWRGFSQLLRSLDIPLDEGLHSWPPNGIAPT